MQVGDELPQLSGAGNIDTRGGFVQKQDLGLVDDSCCDRQLALHAFGIAAEPAVSRLSQIEHLKQLPGSGLSFSLSHSIKRRAETEIVKAGEFRIQIAFVRDHADQMLGRPGVGSAVDAADHTDYNSDLNGA